MYLESTNRDIVFRCSFHQSANMPILPLFFELSWNMYRKTEEISHGIEEIYGTVELCLTYFSKHINSKYHDLILSFFKIKMIELERNIHKRNAKTIFKTVFKEMLNSVSSFRTSTIFTYLSQLLNIIMVLVVA